MERRNQSSATEFILLGFSSHPEYQIPLFFTFLFIYVIILLGNLLIFIVIRIDSRLHTPMYIFLAIMALGDICSTTIIVPRLLVDLLSVKKAISFAACITQLYFFISFGNMGSCLLGIMGFDRYMAICHPLHYMRIMNQRFCITLVISVWVIISIHSLVHSILVSKLIYCGSNEIQHYFCDLPPLLKLSCSDTSTIELLLFTETTAILLAPPLCVLFSYVRIAIVIFKMKSADGRRKAFSTCISHLICIVLAYGPLLFTYIRPSSAYALDKEIGISLLYIMVIPILNPFVYSIRNNDVKEALKKMRSKMHCHK
ncbi:olfactory receptor 1L1-like [Lissotriton helveticus]